MRFTICLGAAVALSAYPGLSQTPPATDTAATEKAAVEAKAEAPAAPPASFQINGTTWTFTRKGQSVQESIDADGNYIANSGDKHVDHGTVVMKGDKACFTSAMNKSPEECWTTTQTEVGKAMETTSDKGEKLSVTRVEYAPMSMPK